MKGSDWKCRKRGKGLGRCTRQDEPPVSVRPLRYFTAITTLNCESPKVQKASGLKEGSEAQKKLRIVGGAVPLS